MNETGDRNPRDGSASGLRDYFLRVEDCFCRQRGAPLLLSPLDYAKAVEWWEAGIPEEVVEEGVRRYFERLSHRKIPQRRAICLSFAEDLVFKVREEQRCAAVGRSAGLAPPEDQALRVRRFLEDRREKLGQALGKMPAGYPVLRRAVEDALEVIESLLPRAKDPLTALEAVLGPADREIGRLALLESTPATLEALRLAASARLGGLADGMGSETRGPAIEALLRREILKGLGLPRLSLLYLED